MKKDKGKYLFCGLFISPAFIVYTGMLVFSVITTLYYSTLKWDGLGSGVFDGLENYIRLFRDMAFWGIARNTLIFIVFSVVLQNIFGIILAYLVSRIFMAYRFFRAVFFLPVVVTSAAVATMFTMFFADNGVVNWFIRSIGLDMLIRPWLMDSKTVLMCVMLPEVWQSTGIYFLIHLAGVQAIPEEVIESARMDGARSPVILLRIIVPMMTEVIQVGVLFSLINAIKSFNFSWMMTFGGPGTASAYVSVYMYKKVFQDFRYGYGSAVAVILLIALILITVSFKAYFNRLARDND
jgi:raffinose/stachyose/melibiose transport system permease protein